MVEVLFQHCADHLLDEVPQWSSAMGPDFVGLTLTEFVMRLTQVPECKSLRFQLCLWLARQVEAKLTDLFGDTAERREQRIFAAPTPVGAKLPDERRPRQACRAVPGVGPGLGACLARLAGHRQEHSRRPPGAEHFLVLERLAGRISCDRTGWQRGRPGPGVDRGLSGPFR